MSKRRLHFHLFHRCCSVYIEPRDAWIGVYAAEVGVYICLLPFVVIKVMRGRW